MDKYCVVHACSKVRTYAGPAREAKGNRWQWKCTQCEKSRQADRHRRRMQRLRDIKAHSGCADCGYADPRALDFHHEDPMDKSSKSFSGWRNWSLVIAEIGKCIVLCANCHRIRHADNARLPHSESRAVGEVLDNRRL